MKYSIIGPRYAQLEVDTVLNIDMFKKNDVLSTHIYIYSQSFAEPFHLGWLWDQSLRCSRKFEDRSLLDFYIASSEIF